MIEQKTWHFLLVFLMAGWGGPHRSILLLPREPPHPVLEISTMDFAKTDQNELQQQWKAETTVPDRVMICFAR